MEQTVRDVIPKYIEPFPFKEHMVGLLLGQVQSGKTGQVFGLITASADIGFPLFIHLQQIIHTCRSKPLSEH